jgi:hypothetical protein
MSKTTTPPHAAGKDAVRKLPPNTSAGAVIPLQSYLKKYHTSFQSELVPATAPHRDADVPPDGYKRVAISLQPLLATAGSPYYAGVFDDDTDFSASLVKVAALFAAGRMLTAAKVAVKTAPNIAAFFTSFNSKLKTEIDNPANTDARIRAKVFPSGSPVGLYPKTAQILLPTGLGTAAATVTFTSVFDANQTDMIVNSGDPTAAAAIDALGYGYISAALVEDKFFDPTNGTGVGIWLAGDYANNNTYIRIPCINDHRDAQLTTTRQMCRMFALIRLNLLPDIDTATNTLMRNLLNEPKPGGTTPWLDPSRVHVGPQFSIVMDKIGFAGLGDSNSPNVYSEGLVIKWNDTSQVDSFNNKIDPGNANPSTHLTGEIAVCWQNLLEQNLSTGFDGIVEVINNSVSDFLDRKAL